MSNNGNKDEFEIWQEGFRVNEGGDVARFVGVGKGKTFIEACRELIARTGFGEIKRDKDGKEYASSWGCRWFSTLEEAQRSFG